MELALITVKQVVVLFILIFAGFVCVKTKAVKMEGKKAFSDLLLYLIVPAMVINSYMMEFNIDILHNLLKAFELSILLLLIGLFITLALTAKHKSPDLPIMRFACIFSNAAYMGFPLIQALFGSEGLLYASAFVTVYNILLWTAGYGIVSKKVRANIWYIILVRQLVIPAVCFGVFSLFHVTGMAAQVVLLLEACPSAAITSVFAVQFGYDENLAAGAVVITTFFSILTLPVCAMLLTA